MNAASITPLFDSNVEPMPRAVPTLPAAPRRAVQKPDALWNAATSPSSSDHEVAQACHISPVLAAILRARGHDSVESARAFLDDETSRHAPDALPDLEVAVARLHRAVEDKEPILICGDYDVDGLTSTALLLRVLRGVGANVQARVPERSEGYDLKVQDVRNAHAAGFSLILTADNGIRAVEPVKLARELGMDVVITDHHLPGRELPPAVAVVNPKRDGSQYPFAHLCGCAVAFKVMEALLRAHWPKHLARFEHNFLEFVAMATIADCMPLHGENRVIVRDGLTKLAFTKKRGLKALMELSRLNPTSGVRAGDVGFVLGPRLNAAGRMSRAQDALQLLTSTDEAECRALAELLETHNRKRQTLTQEMMEQAVARIEESCDLDAERALVVVGRNWKHGLAGLVASRLVDAFARPAIVLGDDGELLCGSGRSIDGFNLHQIIEVARERDLLLKGGGHAGACGLTLQRGNLDALRAVVSECARELDISKLAPRVSPDVLVSGADLTPRLLDELALLEPCGAGNAPAKLMLGNAKVVNVTTMGKEKQHLKWRLKAGNAFFEAVWWRAADQAERWREGSSVDVCFAPEWNEWNGQKRMQLKIEAARDAC